MRGYVEPELASKACKQQCAPVSVCRRLAAFDGCFMFIGIGDRTWGLEPAGQCATSELCPQLITANQTRLSAVRRLPRRSGLEDPAEVKHLLIT